MNNKCIRCGNDLAPNQNFCNCCGLPVTNMVSNTNINSNSNTGKLIVSREKNFYGCAAKLKVLINGYCYTLENGQVLDFNLIPGVYTITWKFWCRRNKSIQINVLAGGYYCVNFKPDYLWGGFKLSDKCKFN